MSENCGDAGERGDSVDARFWCKGQSDVPEATEKVEREGKPRAVDADPYRYRMDYPSIGTCVIINNKNFHKSTGMNLRNGTDLDAGGAMKTFSGLGYKMKMANDLTVGEMEKLLSTGTGKHYAGLKLNQSPSSMSNAYYESFAIYGNAQSYGNANWNVYQ